MNTSRLGVWAILVLLFSAGQSALAQSSVYGYRDPTNNYHNTLEQAEQALSNATVRAAFPTGSSVSTLALDYRAGGVLKSGWPNALVLRGIDSRTEPVYFRTDPWSSYIAALDPICQALPPCDGPPVGSAYSACASEAYETTRRRCDMLRKTPIAGKCLAAGYAESNPPTVLGSIGGPLQIVAGSFPATDPWGIGRQGATRVYNGYGNFSNPSRYVQIAYCDCPPGQPNYVCPPPPGAAESAGLRQNIDPLAIAETNVAKTPVVQEEYFWCEPGFAATVGGAANSPCSADETKLVVEPEKFKQTDTCTEGNPCAPSNGNKTVREIDFSFGGFEFTRYYNSLRELRPYGFFDRNWSHSFSARIITSDLTDNHVPGTGAPGSCTVFVQDEETHLDSYDAIPATPSCSANQWRSTVNTGSVLSFDASANKWRLFSESGEVQVFDQYGRFVEKYHQDDLAGKLTITYTLNNATTEKQDWRFWRVEAVRDARGRGLNFHYDVSADGRLIKISDTQLNVLAEYTYDFQSRLASVKLPNAAGGTSTRVYSYGETAFAPAILKYHLTGITDELGVRYATYSYDSNGRVTSSQHAGGAGAVSISYAANDASATVTRVAGEAVTYNFGTHTYRSPSSIQSVRGTITRIYGASCSSGGVIDTRLCASTDARGTTTQYSYDALHEVTRVEAVGTTVARRIERTFDASWQRINSRVVKSGEIVGSPVIEKMQYAYNARGQIAAQCEIDPAVSYTCSDTSAPPAGSKVRRTLFTYCESITTGCPIVGLLKTVNGPRPTTDPGMGGQDDIMTYTYYDADDTGCASGGTCNYRKGDRASMTDALGWTTQYTKYDAAGRLLSSTDPNGVVTELEYYPRGWLKTRKVRLSTEAAGAATVTQFIYDNAGNLTKVIQPDNTFVKYFYDAAHRLYQISDGDIAAASNRVTFTLDAAGNRTVEETYDPTGVLKRKLSRVYNTLNQLTSNKNAQDQATVFTLDANGNQLTATDPLTRLTESTYDALGRLTQSIGDKGIGRANATTGYTYDARDALTRVTDPKGLFTDYTYDGLKDLIALSSPDTGLSNYVYDRAGNRIQQTDARSVISTMIYDRLNRLTNIQYPTTSLNVTFTYDVTNADCATGETYAKGRLTKMVDASGETRYCYDKRGNLARKVQVVDGITRTLSFTYTVADRLNTITYPSGMVITYGRDTLGRITSVQHQASAGGAVTNLVTAATYYPFGPTNTITFGDGKVITKALDQNYWPDYVSSNRVGGLILDFGLDAVGNIVSTAPTVSGSANATYGYDGLYRLASVSGAGATAQGFTYDATGNRLTKGFAGVNSTYTYPSNTHRLGTVDGVPREYDANGNLTYPDATVRSGRSYQYDDRNRMITASNNSSPIWYQKYSGRGERVRTQEGGIVGGNTTRYYIFQEGGSLLGVYNNTGGRLTEYIYMDGMLVAKSNDSGTSEIRYIETDHLGSPRAAFTTTGTKTWEWTFGGSAFGEHAANNDVDGDNKKEELSLRFPGQQYDAKTGLHYNYFRDYEPQTGRYLESDPIGLKGGINTYGYVLGSPIGYADTLGLSPDPVYDVPTCAGATGAVLCDGSGGLLVTNCDKSCTRRCTQLHEEEHKRFLSIKFPGACKGRPRGTAPYPNGLPYDQFVLANAETECRAYAVSLRCLSELEGSAEASCEPCKSSVADAKANANRWRKYYKCNAYGW